MARILQNQFFQIRHKFPSIKRYGLAVEYFPKYINRAQNLHAVDVVLLSFILRGRGRHLLGDEVHHLKGSSIGVTHYGQMHAIVTERQGIEVYNIYLDLRNHTLPVLPEDLRATLSAILPIHPRLLHQLNRRVAIRIEDPAPLVASLRRIEEEMDSSGLGAQEIVQHSFHIFLIDLCRAAQRHGFTLASAKNDAPIWVEKLRQEIDSHFVLPHALGTMAKSAGVSIAYLCRQFKDYTGKTVIRYLVERRIQAAIWKLREGDEKIISIALACGFNDLAYFNRVFKRIVGTTPSKYRHKIKRGEG